MSDTRIDGYARALFEVARAEEAGLLLEHDERTYAFCRGGCRRAFVEDPTTYVAQAEELASRATREKPAGLPVIDEGMRLWYESCACCLSEAFPEIKAQLDAERATEQAAS